MVGEIYLGDGAYARFDGYAIWLAANHPSNETVALEPDVMERLIEFYKFCKSGDVTPAEKREFR